jgi:hypothetical protein
MSKILFVGGNFGDNIKNTSINLLGHGSIVFASDLDCFESIKYEARPIPEF